MRPPGQVLCLLLGLNVAGVLRQSAHDSLCSSRLELADPTKANSLPTVGCCRRPSFQRLRQSEKAFLRNSPLPNWGLAGVLLRTNTARALGGAGGLKAPGIF